MDFEELTRKITDIKDKEMAMEFTQTIGKLLKENGVTVHCLEYDQNIMAGNLLEGRYGVVFDKLDFTEHDKKFIDEIECWKKKCSDFRDCYKHLKHDLEKCENEKDENKELPSEPLDAAKMLIEAEEKREHSKLAKDFGCADTYNDRKYSVDNLKQIAEYLLVYCKHNNAEV